MAAKNYWRSSIEERLLDNLEFLDNGCDVFKGTKTPTGYGRISFHGKHEYTHRVSWILHEGVIPEGLYVLHKCDNPSCCNIEHLWVGTQSENIKDMHDKRKQAQARWEAR